MIHHCTLTSINYDYNVHNYDDQNDSGHDEIDDRVTRVKSASRAFRVGVIDWLSFKETYRP